MVFVPVTRQQLEELASKGSLGGQMQAFVANDRLRETFEIFDYKDAQEEAEMAALQVAGVWGLIASGERLIVVADADGAELSPGDESENGGVRVSGLDRKRVVSWFCDEEPPNSELTEKLAGQSLDEAWQLAQDFMAEHDLSWHDLSEV